MASQAGRHRFELARSKLQVVMTGIALNHVSPNDPATQDDCQGSFGHQKYSKRSAHFIGARDEDYSAQKQLDNSIEDHAAPKLPRTSISNVVIGSHVNWPPCHGVESDGGTQFRSGVGSMK
jgi:hypothetical protein